MKSEDSIVVERDNDKGFTPAVDQDIYRQGSISNQTMISRQAKKELTEASYQAAEECTQLITKNNASKLIQYLEGLPSDLSINKIVDEDGYSLLHMATFNNRTRCIIALLEKAKKDLY